MSELMNAAVLHTYGEALRVTPVERPRLRPGHVLVRVEASGVNPLDTKIRDGLADHARTVLPAILGIDLAGTVADVADDVTTFVAGDLVYGMTGGVGGVPGSLAEYAVVDARLLARRPAAWTARQAAAVPLAAITAWEGLVDRAAVGSGQRVLVHGGAGGVGHLAVQLARARGADVYATGSGDGLDVIEQYGATAIDRTTTSAPDYVERYTAGAGFDVVFDTVGGSDPGRVLQLRPDLHRPRRQHPRLGHTRLGAAVVPRRDLLRRVHPAAAHHRCRTPSTTARSSTTSARWPMPVSSSPASTPGPSTWTRSTTRTRPSPTAAHTARS